MTGKEKCEFLKEIRKTMAKENGITYVPRECHHEGECSGTCPLCEKEAAELLAELKKKAIGKKKKQIYMALYLGIIINIYINFLMDLIKGISQM